MTDAYARRIPGVHQRLCRCGELVTLTEETTRPVGESRLVRRRAGDCPACGAEVPYSIPADSDEGTSVDYTEAQARRGTWGARLRRIERWLARRLLTQPEDLDGASGT